jgi:hypothetical protein
VQNGPRWGHVKFVKVMKMDRRSAPFRAVHSRSHSGATKIPESCFLREGAATRTCTWPAVDVDTDLQNLSITRAISINHDLMEGNKLDKVGTAEQYFLQIFTPSSYFTLEWRGVK